MTIAESRQQLLQNLAGIYDEREAISISDMVLEKITGLKKIDRIIDKNKKLSAPQLELLENYTESLRKHVPVQYILHEAWFCGMKFYVDENVLIPRPETEELVDWLLQEITVAKTQSQYAGSILDIGTGSGCIAIALKKKLAAADIDACDISMSALNVAAKNAIINDVKVNFMQTDFLKIEERKKLPLYDFIISNPPYIPSRDKSSMRQNVLDHEPHLALFVENDNPLIFYDAIAEFAKEKLSAGGKIFVELHEELSERASALFFSRGFSFVEVKKDMQGKNRMIKVMA